MPFKISTSVAKIVATNASAITPDPTATVWSRLEPLPTSDDVAESLQARVADPLWMLARQWQFNEFQGEDAGSPIGAVYKILGLPVTTLLPSFGSTAAQAINSKQPPVEALIEREVVLAKHAKLNAQAGQQLMRMLRASGLGEVVTSLLGAYPAAIEAPDDPVADNAGFVWNRLLDGAAIDALALAADARPVLVSAVAFDPFAANLGIAAGQHETVRKALVQWIVWLDDLVLEGSGEGASPYWNPHRLEYAFALGTESVAPGLRLEADEYTTGKLDWHTFTVGAGAASHRPARVGEFVPKRSLLPTLARYPGMPADRYWEFEDGRVNFGMLGAAKSDLARLAVLEYALVFGNDWFVLPITLPTNALYRVASLTVRDNFGIDVPIPPARNLDGTQWTMFEMSVQASSSAPRERLQDILYLCPAVETLEGPPLEHVLMMRDEMANMVWGIEKRVQGTSGEPLDRKFESTRLTTTQTLRAAEGAVLASGAPLHYRLQTPVQAHWIPFLPVRKAGATVQNWSIQLQRGVVTHHYQVTQTRLDDPRNAEYKEFIDRLKNASFVEQGAEGGPVENRLQGFMFHPRGTLLRLAPNALVASDYLRIEEEEVPRDGIELKRCFNYARDARGRAVLWIGRSKQIGRGEGNSGLRFDVIERGKR